MMSEDGPGGGNSSWTRPSTGGLCRGFFNNRPCTRLAQASGPGWCVPPPHALRTCFLVLALSQYKSPLLHNQAVLEKRRNKTLRNSSRASMAKANGIAYSHTSMFIGAVPNKLLPKGV